MKKRPAPSPFLSSSLHDPVHNQMRSAAAAMPTGSRNNFYAGDENKSFDASNKDNLMKRRAMKNAPPSSASSSQAPKRPPWVSPNTRSPIRFTHNPSPPYKLSPSLSPRKILGERNEPVEPYSPSPLPLLVKLGKRKSPTTASVTAEDDCSIISKSTSTSSSLTLPFFRGADGEEVVLEEDLHRRMQEFLDEQMLINHNNQVVEEDGGGFSSPKMAYNNPIFVPTSPPVDSREEGVLFPLVNRPEGDGSSDLEETPKMGILSLDSDRNQENKETPDLIALDTSAVMEIAKEQVIEEMGKYSEFDRTPENKETPMNNQADLIAVDTATVTQISKMQIIEEVLRTPEINGTSMNNLEDQTTANDYTEGEMKEDGRDVATDIFTHSPFPGLVRIQEIDMINSPSLREAFIEEDDEEVSKIEMMSSEEDEHDDDEGSMVKLSLRCLFMLICFGTVLLSSDNPRLLPSAFRQKAVSSVVEGYLKPCHMLSQKYMTVFNGLWDENMSSSCYIPVGNLEDLQMPSSLNSFLGHISKWVNDSGAIDISILIWSEIESCFARFAQWVSDILWHKSSETEDVVSDNVSDEDLLHLFREWDLIHEYDLQAAASDLQSRSSAAGKEELTKSLLSLTDDPDVQLLLMDLMDEDGNMDDHYEAFERQRKTTRIDDNAAASASDNGDDNAMQSSSMFMDFLEKGAVDMMISESQSITHDIGEGSVGDMTETSEAALLPEEVHPIQQLVGEILDTTESSAQGLPEVEESAMAMQKQQIILEESTCPIHSVFVQAMGDFLGLCDVDAAHDGYTETRKLPLISEQEAVAQSLLLNWGSVPPLVVSAIAMSVAIVMMMAFQQVNLSQMKKKMGRLNSNDSALPLREVEFLRRTTPTQQKQMMEEEGSTPNGYETEVSSTYESEVKTESTTAVHSRLDSPSFGSFVAYELLPKEGQLGNSSAEKKLTPVRRSSRLLRTQVMSPLKPRRVALSPP